MAQHNLNIRVYVIPNLQQYFILGTDTIQKFNIVTDYENEQLSIKKNMTLKIVNAIVIKPKSKAILSVAPSDDLHKGLYGKIIISSFLTKLGLKCDCDETVIKSDKKNLVISVNNISNRTTRLRKGINVAQFTAINKADVTTVPRQLNSINNTQDSDLITSNSNTQFGRPINCAETNYSLPKSSQHAFDKYNSMSNIGLFYLVNLI